MKYNKSVFGWNIYELEGITTVYYIAIKDGYSPVEGSTIGETIENASKVQIETDSDYR